MARALVHQASGDYLGMADALGPWRDGSALDGRSRVYAVLGGGGRRTGNRKEAVERLRRANSLFGGLRAAPFVARVEAELAACHLPANRKQSALR